MDLARRRFLQAKPRLLHVSNALPWLKSTQHMLDACTRCGDCVTACPTGVVVKGEGGFPALDFKTAECTFCHACTDVCSQPLFDLQKSPWQAVVSVQSSCLNQHGVYCRSCLESCEIRALSVEFLGPGQQRIQLNNDVCNGCGACVAICPEQAISIQNHVWGDTHVG